MKRKSGYFEDKLYAVRRLNAAVTRFLNSRSHSDRDMAYKWASAWGKMIDKLRFMTKEDYDEGKQKNG